MFNSQHPHGGLESSVTPVPGDQKTDPLYLNELCEHGNMVHLYTVTQTNIHKTKKQIHL